MGHFLCPLTLLTNQKIKVLKKKNAWRYYFTLYILHFTTNNNHYVWFRIYEARQTEFFAILGYFLPFYQKIKILKKWKKFLEILSFTQVYHKYQSYDIWFLRYQLQQTVFFVIFGHFFPFYPPNSPNVIVIFHFELFFTLSPP